MKEYLIHKIKNSRKIMLFILLLTVINVLILMAPGDLSSSYTYTTYFMMNLQQNLQNFTCIYMLLVFILGIRLMSCNGLEEKILPFKNTSRYLVSYFAGAAYILLNFVIIAAAAMIHYERFYTLYSERNITSVFYIELMQYDSLGNGLVYILQMFLACLTVYTIAGFSRLITKYSAGASGYAFVIILFPIYVLNAAAQIIIRAANINFDFEKVISLFSVFETMMSDNRSFGISGENIYVYHFNLENQFGNIVGLTIITLFLVILGFVTQRFVDGTSGRQTCSVLYDRVMRIGIGIYIIVSIPIYKPFHDCSTAVLLTAMAIVFIIVELLLARYMGGTSKYDYMNKKGAAE